MSSPLLSPVVDHEGNLGRRPSQPATPRTRPNQQSRPPSKTAGRSHSDPVTFGLSRSSASPFGLRSLARCIRAYDCYRNHSLSSISAWPCRETPPKWRCEGERTVWEMTSSMAASACVCCSRSTRRRESSERARSGGRRPAGLCERTVEVGGLPRWRRVAPLPLEDSRFGSASCRLVPACYPDAPRQDMAAFALDQGS